MTVRSALRLAPVALLSTLLVISTAPGCGSDTPNGNGTKDGSSLDVGSLDGASTPDTGTYDSGQDDGSTNPGDTGGGRDAAMLPADAGPDPRNPDNDHLDSDCDGLSDAYEFATVYPGGMKTSPSNSDSDGDGIPDGVEVGVTTIVAGSGCAVVAFDADPTTHTSPVAADTDNDGIPDGLEDANKNGTRDQGELDPLARDSDGDGIPDGIEDANKNGVKDSGETDGNARDSDGDGIADGVEDANQNGMVDSGETDPRLTDSDGDTLADGVEDSNHNGVHDRTETDPRTSDSDCDGLSDAEELMLGTSPILDDTDHDGILDGVELGRTAPVMGSMCPAFMGDQDPATTTNPTNPDTDQDGIPDGQEDRNGNGRVDMGETNPRSADTDGDGIPDGDEILTGSNPLDPNSPDPTARSGVAAVCADGALKMVDFDVDTAGNWTLANETSSVYAGIPVAGAADTHVATLEDNSQHFAGFVVSMPLIAGSNPTAVDQSSGLSARFMAGAAAQQLGVAQRTSPRLITSHDGFGAAVSGVWDVNVTTGNMNASEVRNALLRVTTGLAANAFTGLGTGTGSSGNAYTMSFELLVRPAASQIVIVVAVLDRPTFDSPSNPASLFLADLTNGTALAQANARRSKACNPFTAAGQSIADFIWMADISPSTDDDRGRISSAAQAVFVALQNNGVDFRMAVVPHTSNPFNVGAGNAGQFRGVGFTRDRTQFINYMQDTSGTDGCEFGLSAADAAIARALPRTAPGAANENAAKIRGDATLAVMYVTDEFAQELTEGQCNLTLPCSTGVRDAYTTTPDDTVCQLNPNAAQQMCINQILAPYLQRLTDNGVIAFAQTLDPNPPGPCNGGQFHCPQPGSQLRNEPGRGYTDLVQSTGGVFYSPCLDNPGSSALQAIVDAVSGAASQFQLSGTPISSTIKVGITHGTTTVIVPRDKQNGFDYDPAANSIFFRGTSRPAANDHVTISYRVWLPPEAPCGMPCGPNQICDGQLGVCVCDAGQCNATCTANQVCNSDCQCTCGADCNGNCSGNQRCNAATCACECPADCGGCPSGTVCNPNSCACECDQNCGGACAGTNLVCNTGACNCQCPADCGGRCGAGTVCNTSTCDCACGGGCDQNCPGNARCNPANNCTCECPADCGGCQDGTVCNQANCTCECTGTACPNREIRDPNAQCQCVCPADCGGCQANERCDPTDCRCVPIV
ncbi:MAG: hypothetical protein U1E65_31690 [Myxococcota bacterium]